MRFGRGRRRRAPGSSARRQLRRLAVLLAVAVTIASITGYVVISFTVNGLPSYQPSTGWVAVLQPAGTPDVDTVQLLVQARTQGSQTRAAYDVVVCGPRPYTGDLLIGGSALLTAIQPSPVFPGSAPPPLRVCAYQGSGVFPTYPVLRSMRWQGGIARVVGTGMPR